MEECCSWIGAMSSEQFDIENRLSLDVYCSIFPRLLARDFDSGFVNRNSIRLRLKWVVTSIRHSIYLLPNCFMRVLNAE